MVFFQLFYPEGVISVSMVERIKVLCSQRGTSIPRLEQELGFGKGAIYNWDKSSPSIDKVAKVAAYFDVSTDYIFGIKKDENINPDIRVLFRAGKRLSDEDAKKLRQVAEALFPEAFKD